MVSVPSGGRPRHGLKMWRRIARRVHSDIEAEKRLSGESHPCKSSCISGKLSKYDNNVHNRVKITRDADAEGYAS